MAYAVVLANQTQVTPVCTQTEQAVLYPLLPQARYLGLLGGACAAPLPSQLLTVLSAGRIHHRRARSGNRRRRCWRPMPRRLLRCALPKNCAALNHAALAVTHDSVHHAHYMQTGCAHGGFRGHRAWDGPHSRQSLALHVRPSAAAQDERVLSAWEQQDASLHDIYGI